MTYDTVKKNYGRTWGDEEVKLAVRKGAITKEEYKEITGKEYPVRKKV